MFERAAAKPFPVRLRLSGQRILAPQGEAILGWLGGGSAGAAQPLAIPDRLLAPHPTSNIVYACNLPTAGDHDQATVLDVCGQLPNEIGGDLEDGFLAASLPGGQTAVVTPEGERATILFRWICLTAHVSIGAVWRCFVRVGSRGAGAWRALEHDYIFDAEGGIVLNPPDAVAIPCTDVMLSHPEGRLTSFPCGLGRVKVTKLTTDGWPKRHVLGIMMQDDNRIVAFLSDGRQEMIATAAPSSRRAARAA